MLTDKDINKLVQVFPTKEEVRAIIREETADLRKSIQDLVKGIDKLVTAFEELRLEYVSIKVQLDRHERWFKQIADKTGLKLVD